MRPVIAMIALLLAGCSTATPHRDGAVLQTQWPQIDEQCRAQPDFPGCHGR